MFRRILDFILMLVIIALSVCILVNIAKIIATPEQATYNFLVILVCAVIILICYQMNKLNSAEMESDKDIEASQRLEKLKQETKLKSFRLEIFGASKLLPALIICAIFSLCFFIPLKELEDYIMLVVAILLLTFAGTMLILEIATF